MQNAILFCIIKTILTTLANIEVSIYENNIFFFHKYVLFTHATKPIIIIIQILYIIHNHWTCDSIFCKDACFFYDSLNLMIIQMYQ